MKKGESKPAMAEDEIFYDEKVILINGEDYGKLCDCSGDVVDVLERLIRSSFCADGKNG